MASGVINKHRIQVSATVRNNSGGTAYAFALDHNPSIWEIKEKIKDGKFTLTTMTNLGTFDVSGTSLSNNVTTFIQWDSVESAIASSDLVSFDDSNADAVVGEYYMFIYAVDLYQNTNVMAHPQNPIRMTTETIVLTRALDLLYGDGSVNYAEQRNGVSDANVTLLTPLFDFYNGRTDMLYANISVDPNESAVNEVSVVAFSSQIVPMLNVSTFSHKTVIYQEIFGSAISIEESIDTFFTDMTDTTGTLFNSANWYGQTFYVYVVMHDIGFDKWIVTEFEVQAGVPPNLSDSTAEIIVV